MRFLEIRSFPFLHVAIFFYRSEDALKFKKMEELKSKEMEREEAGRLGQQSG